MANICRDIGLVESELVSNNLVHNSCKLRKHSDQAQQPQLNQYNYRKHKANF